MNFEIDKKVFAKKEKEAQKLAKKIAELGGPLRKYLAEYGHLEDYAAAVTLVMADLTPGVREPVAKIALNKLTKNDMERSMEELKLPKEFFQKEKKEETKELKAKLGMVR